MAENELSLRDRLEDAMFDALGDLQNIAEEMFVRFYTASGTAAQEKGRNLTLMQEVQRLEEENGRLRTELDNEQEKLARARDEVEKCKSIVEIQLKSLEKLKEENRVLSEENYKMETQIRQMVAKEAKDGNPSAAEQRKLRRQTSPCDAGPVSLEADSSICTREPSAAVACPRCGSMDVRMDVFGTGIHRCEVCGKTFGVHEYG